MPSMYIRSRHHRWATATHTRAITRSFLTPSATNDLMILLQIARLYLEKSQALRPHPVSPHLALANATEAQTYSLLLVLPALARSPLQRQGGRRIRRRTAMSASGTSRQPPTTANTDGGRSTLIFVIHAHSIAVSRSCATMCG